MAIIFNENDKTFTINTKSTTYQMKIDSYDVLSHTYYGKRVGYSDMSFSTPDYGAAFSPNVADHKDGAYYSHTHNFPEISAFGLGDFRINALTVKHADGSVALNPKYVSHKIEKGKYRLKGLPSFYGDDAESLIVTLKDDTYDIYLHLYYGVFEKYDLITRALEIENKSNAPIKLEKALSMSLDLPWGSYELISFRGRHMLERCLERTKIGHSTLSISSMRGASSHMQNPFVMVAEEGATEDYGSVFGISLVYSGNFIISTEKDPFERTRVVAGINPDCFSYEVLPNDSFVTPEVALVYSSEGFSKMTNCYHKAIRNNLCRGKYQFAKRPVLINSWEAAYFDFNADKLVGIASEAATLGVDLFVMDDGWFGKRDDDHTSLGDWFTNEEKLQGPLSDLVNRINALGMQFGIWFEPECISEKSELYRAHPDYAFKIPNRVPQLSRQQYILDFSRKEIRDNIYSQLAKILNSANIAYVKWDFNRHISDIYSVDLPPERQGEVYHRYILGLYELLERITNDFPNVLFESCSGGGGRFDCGMLHYMPQVWTSDNTDALDRLKIQYGTSFCYPIRTMGAHVSVCPNHGTAGIAPLSTRGNVAYFGTYGLELDVTKMTAEEKEEIKRQIKEFKELYDLIQFGDYYRLVSPYNRGKSLYSVWETVKEDGSEALVCAVRYENECAEVPEFVKVKGLIADKWYVVNGDKKYLGDALMNIGIKLDYQYCSFPSKLYHITLA